MDPRIEEFPERKISLAGKITGVFLLLLIGTAAAAVSATRLDLSPITVFLLILLVILPIGVWVIARVLRPLTIVLSGLSDGIRSFHDRDFSFRLAYQSRDELGDLVRLYNRVGELLHQERKAVTQRELLLQTALDRSPAAIVLLNPNSRVVYSNREARHLLFGNTPLEGHSFEEIAVHCPAEMQQILVSRGDGLFTVLRNDTAETYHLSQRRFLLNRRKHQLVLLRRMTGELGRREAETWKKVLRVIFHELNNSMAPVSSLLHSARQLVRRPEKADQSEEVFDIIRSRLDHLQNFIEGYARFARLPAPRKQEVVWQDFLSAFAEEPVRLEIDAAIRPGWFDPAQMQHVIVNLLKNAKEASRDGATVVLSVKSHPNAGSVLQVIDRGKGMDEETLQKALLPFYSTKESGSGLGLALCREILDAHGGRLSLENNSAEGLTVTCWLPTRSALATD